MKTFVEFYFPGFSVGGMEEREVTSRTHEAIGKIPECAISYRFFDKDVTNTKVNFSPYHFLGTEYTYEEFKKKFPQAACEPEYKNVERVVKVTTGGFYSLAYEDVVIAV